ncbi:hypothetical protein LINGRAHAP2_LOCUS36737 [Linum grandiflorum]
MSGIVDMWSNEAAKLKEKNGQSILSDSTSTGKLVVSGINEFIQRLKTAKKLPAFEFSEASISVMVDGFSA